jgi:hypothetical protein
MKNRMLSSYQKQALTVMISPLCTNCNDITVILLNVALNTIKLTLYLQRHITYQEMAIWKSIVTLIYSELLALGKKIDKFKPMYRYLLAFGR